MFRHRPSRRPAFHLNFPSPVGATVNSQGRKPLDHFNRGQGPDADLEGGVGRVVAPGAPRGRASGGEEQSAQSAPPPPAGPAAGGDKFGFATMPVPPNGHAGSKHQANTRRLPRAEWASRITGGRLVFIGSGAAALGGVPH